MSLRVIQGGTSQAVEAYAPPPFDLADQPRRPGIAYERVAVTLTKPQIADVERASAADGVPIELWAAIAIEAHRGLAAICELLDVDPGRIAEGLDAAALARADLFPGRYGRRLSAYARALRRGSSPTSGKRSGRLMLAVAYHTLVAWEREAVQRSTDVGSWAGNMLAGGSHTRAHLWEAAAAETGQTLAEWIALQAARLSRR